MFSVLQSFFLKHGIYTILWNIKHNKQSPELYLLDVFFSKAYTEATTYIQSGGPPFTIAKLVNIIPISLWFVLLIQSYNELVTGLYKPTYNWFSPHMFRALFCAFPRPMTFGRTLLLGMDERAARHCEVFFF